MGIRDYITIIETGFKNLLMELELLEYDPVLVPAIKHLPTGKIYRGKPGQYHHDVAQENGLYGVNWKYQPDLETGFVNHKGHFINRQRALDYALRHDLLHDRAKQYLATDDAPAELGASFLKK